MGFQVLFNPKANNGQGEINAKVPKSFFGTENYIYSDITKIKDYKEFFGNLPAGEKIVLCGGDGTLNRFINEAEEFLPNINLYLYPTGSGNDFYREVGNQTEKMPVCVDEYIKNLPVVTVNGKSYKFINGVGFGIDGYCCEEGDRRKEKSDKPINYTSIAITGLLFHFKARNAVVTVDGKEYTFKKAWIAPTMIGKYYGGGMIPTPGQDRLNKEKTVSVMVMYGAGKIGTLAVFPSIFKGEHVKHEKMVSVYTGKNVKVKFDMPTPLQVDGETISGVTEYEVNF